MESTPYLLDHHFALGVDFAADHAHLLVDGLSAVVFHCHPQKPICAPVRDVFDYYALLSGGIFTPSELNDKSKPKLIFISCGSRERPDAVKGAAAALKDAGYNAVSFISENTAHEFLTWRRSLHELAPLLFKN